MRRVPEVMAIRFPILSWCILREQISLSQPNTADRDSQTKLPEFVHPVTTTNSKKCPFIEKAIIVQRDILKMFISHDSGVGHDRQPTETHIEASGENRRWEKNSCNLFTV